MSTRSPAISSSVVMPSGWPLFGMIASGLTLAMFILAAAQPTDLEAVRVVVRTTAQTSLALFCLAFAASSLARLVSLTPTRWLLANRRQLGVSFAFSHGLHALALYAFFRVRPDVFASVTDPAMFIFGGMAYAFIVLMTLTSFDWSAALVGPRAWRLLHLTGGWWIWATFMVAEGKRALHDTYYWPFVGALVVVGLLRLLAGRARQEG